MLRLFFTMVHRTYGAVALIIVEQALGEFYL
jgi:hypothetical protein